MKRYKKAENKTYLAFCCMLLDWDGGDKCTKRRGYWHGFYVKNHNGLFNILMLISTYNCTM